jgi:hypothetical protein
VSSTCHMHVCRYVLHSVQQWNWPQTLLQAPACMQEAEAVAGHYLHALLVAGPTRHCVSICNLHTVRFALHLSTALPAAVPAPNVPLPRFSRNRLGIRKAKHKCIANSITSRRNTVYLDEAPAAPSRNAGRAAHRSTCGAAGDCKQRHMRPAHISCSPCVSQRNTDTVST